jgi:hypothetical protein
VAGGSSRAILEETGETREAAVEWMDGSRTREQDEPRMPNSHGLKTSFGLAHIRGTN